MNPPATDDTVYTELFDTARLPDDADGQQHVRLFTVPLGAFTAGGRHKGYTDTNMYLSCMLSAQYSFVATRLHIALSNPRGAVLLDLAYSADAYAPLARERTTNVQRGMFL